MKESDKNPQQKPETPVPQEQKPQSEQTLKFSDYRELKLKLVAAELDECEAKFEILKNEANKLIDKERECFLQDIIEKKKKEISTLRKQIIKFSPIDKEFIASLRPDRNDYNTVSFEWDDSLDDFWNYRIKEEILEYPGDNVEKFYQKVAEMFYPRIALFLKADTKVRDPELEVVRGGEKMKLKAWWKILRKIAVAFKGVIEEDFYYTNIRLDDEPDELFDGTRWGQIAEGLDLFKKYFLDRIGL